MAEKIKIGIIGCGGIANGKHMPSLAKVKEVEMVAFCDIVPERAERACKAYGSADAKVYTDYKELLDSGIVDAVLIAVPHYDHPTIAIEAFKRGINVLTEKPAGVYTKKVREMNAVADKSDKIFAIMFYVNFNGFIVIVCC